MKKTFFRSIKTKLVSLFLLMAIIPLVLMGVLAYRNFEEALEKEAFEKLTVVAELKTNWISNYLKKWVSDTALLSKAPSIVATIAEMENVFKDSQKTFTVFAKSAEYEALIKKIDLYLKDVMDRYNCEDLFLIDNTGNVVYTVLHESDFGANMITGKYNDSNLAKVTKKILKGEVRSGLTDFEFYAPSGNMPAAFSAHGIYTDQGEILAVVALQLSIQEIDVIMQQAYGMGKTGETYLVGGDYLMRSNSRFASGDTILKRKIDTEGIRDVFAAKQVKRGPGICKNWIYKDYRENYVLGHNHYLGGVDWAVMTEIDKSEAFAPALRLRNTVFVIVVLIVIAVTIVAVIVSNRISNPIMRLANFAEEVAKGDLTKTISVKNGDEIGVLANSFNTMVKGLAVVLVKMQDAVNQIASAGNEIAAASQQQAAGAREQSSARSETTSAATELSKSAEQVGENIKTVSQAAHHALDGMATIKGLLGSTNTIISSLSERSQKIGNITELIDDVADRTNLLAVNAAIEAARAGEQGRGFTVVADEIRKLSDSTAKSTKDITALIEIIQHEISNVIMSMEKSVNSVDEEVQLSKNVAESSKEISMSANQQMSGSKQIADAMVNINDAMKQIASGAQQSQVAAKQLTTLAQELKGVAGNFKL